MNLTRNLGVLILAVLLVQFGSPITLYGRPFVAVYILMEVGMVVFGVSTVRSEGQPIAPMLGLGALVLAGGAWFLVAPGSNPATLAVNLAVGAFMLALVGYLLVFIFRREGATQLDLILAAVAVYLLLGGIFKSAFVAIELLDPGSFINAEQPGRPLAWQDLLYYSYVTLSTLGYGEIVPVTGWARSMATLEAITGPLVLATIIARLVGSYARPGDQREVQEP